MCVKLPSTSCVFPVTTHNTSGQNNPTLSEEKRRTGLFAARNNQHDSRLRVFFCLKLTYGIRYGNRLGGSVGGVRVRVRVSSINLISVLQAAPTRPMKKNAIWSKSSGGMHDGTRLQATAGGCAGSLGERRPRLHRENEAAARGLGVDGAAGLLEGLQRPQGARVVQGGQEEPGEAQSNRAPGKQSRILFLYPGLLLSFSACGVT